MTARRLLTSLICCAVSFLPAAAGLAPGATNTQAIAALPLASSEMGRKLFDDAVKNLALDVNFRFLDKTYENDVYVREPITGKKVRTACVRLRATSGFRFTLDPPVYSLSTQGLSLEENIARLDADGILVKIQLGPCADVAGGFGVRLRDVKLTYKARPTIQMQDGGCSVRLNPNAGESRVTIGDLNILGLQNDLDKLAKDAVREGINASLVKFFDTSLSGGLGRSASKTCGGGKGR